MTVHDTRKGHGPNCVLTVVDVEAGLDHPARTRTFHDASAAQLYALEAVVSGNPVSINGHRFTIDKEEDL